MRKTILAGLLAAALLPAAAMARDRHHENDHGGRHSEYSETRYDRSGSRYHHHRRGGYERAPHEDRYVRRDRDHVVHYRSYHHVVDHGDHRHVHHHVRPHVHHDPD